MPRRNDQDGLYQRPDSKKYWASFVDGRGKRTRRSTGTADRKEAEALLAKWKLEAHQEKHWEREPPRLFDELMLLYLQGPSTRKRAAERDHFSAKKLFQVFSGCDLNALGSADISGYIEGRMKAGVEPGTINKEIGLLSAAIRWARRELEWNIPNPAEGRRLKEPEGRIRWIDREESEQLLAAASSTPHLVDFIRLGLNTGMRKGEMLGLDWRRVDLKANLVYLGSQHQKSGKHGSIPLNQAAREALPSRADFRASHRPYTFFVFCNRKGARIANIRTAFASACR